jgi:hypothetical protein
MGKYRKPGETVVSKQGERQALQDIGDILRELGDDSYIAAALDGCLDIARENIENDSMCSMKQRYDTAAKELRRCEEANTALRAQVKCLEAAADSSKDTIYIQQKQNQGLAEALRDEKEKSSRLARTMNQILTQQGAVEADGEYDAKEAMRTRAEERSHLLDDIILTLSRESARADEPARAALLHALRQLFDLKDLVEQYRESLTRGESTERREEDGEDMER